MNFTPEQLQTLLAAAGVLGPHFLIRAQPDNGVVTVMGTIPCTTAKIYKFDVIFTGRNPTTGTGVTTRLAISVQGGPAPAALAAAAIVEAAATNMANPPVFTLAVNGLNLELRVNNPVAGDPADVEAIVLGPKISQ